MTTLNNTQTLNILIGGKLGDFIQSLIVPKYIYESTGKKSNIYICNHDQEVFDRGIENAYSALLPVVTNQSYINTFSIYQNESIDVDMTQFRSKANLFTTSWNEFYLHNYVNQNIEIPFNYSWIDINRDSSFNELLLINRNMLPYGNQNAETFYRNYIQGYGNKAYFVCSWKEQYDNFPLKDKIPMLHVPNLTNMFTAIASCKHFIGNLTATAAIATSVNKNRTIEIFSDPIRTKYFHEMKNYDNLICFE